MQFATIIIRRLLPVCTKIMHQKHLPASLALFKHLATTFRHSSSTYSQFSKKNETTSPINFNQSNWFRVLETPSLFTRKTGKTDKNHLPVTAKPVNHYIETYRPHTHTHTCKQTHIPTTLPKYQPSTPALVNRLSPLNKTSSPHQNRCPLSHTAPAGSAGGRSKISRNGQFGSCFTFKLHW